MTRAQEIVVVYGVMSLAYGFGLGIPLSRERMAAPAASRHLVIAHLSAILQGAMYLGLSAAFAMSELTSSLETSAALLLVCGSVLFVTGATLNWRQHVEDHFAERSPGWRCFAVSSVGHLVGMTLVLVGVVMGV
jgi:acyl-coenzyme A synthetase/AMP-(fatty) acid ligase